MGNETIQNEQCCPRCGAPEAYTTPAFAGTTRTHYICGNYGGGHYPTNMCDYAAGLRARLDNLAECHRCSVTVAEWRMRAERAEAALREIANEEPCGSYAPCSCENYLIDIAREALEAGDE